MTEYLINHNWVALISALIGVFGVLLGVWITSNIENKRRRKEIKDMAKPIIINYTGHIVTETSSFAKFNFKSTGDDDCGKIVGYFKNTDNGILFFDRIETDSKTYYPEEGSTVDKNSQFLISLDRIAYDSFQSCKIFCRDIYGTTYQFNAKFCFGQENYSKIKIENSIPIEIKTKDKKKSKSSRKK